MKADVSENQLRDYVLGVLPEAEQTALEQVLLNDRAKFEEAWAIENELIDRYVRNQMPTIERSQFERHYLASPLHRERVAIAETWLGELDKMPPVQATTISWWQRWREAFRIPQLAFGAALATALLLTVAGALWLLRERAQWNDQLAQLRDQSQTEAQRRAQDFAAQQQQLEKALAQEQQRNQQLKTELEKLQQQKEPVTTPALLSFLLTSATTRDRNSSPTTIPRNPRGMQLLMELSGATYSSYQARLQTVEGRALFNLPARVTKDRAYVGVILPAARLVRGDYVIILSGRNTDGSQEEIDRYFFRVQ